MNINNLDGVSERFSNLIEEAIETNDRATITQIRKCWDNEPWDSIVSKFNAEGSVWYVWWTDGISEYAKLLGV